MSTFNSMDIIDITAKHIALPDADHSIVHKQEDNLHFFRNLIGMYSNEVKSAENVLHSLMQNFIDSREAEVLVYLSLMLASQGISGVTHPSILPIHMSALRIAKLRTDINIDPILIDHINSLHLGATLTGYGCNLTNTCGNQCFGLCGLECSCWSWTCGSCACYLGCWQHDCCCSCLGMTSLCCINVISFSCNGYNNTCQPPEGIFEM